MSKVLTEYEVVRYAAILETILQNKYGTCTVLFQAYKENKKGKPILMVMYDAMVYEETYGLASLDDWYYAHPECHASVEPEHCPSSTRCYSAQQRFSVGVQLQAVAESFARKESYREAISVYV